MNREDTLSLLKELMAVCESLNYAPIVNIHKNPDGWELRVKWEAYGIERGCFDNALLERGLQASVMADGYTVFRKRTNIN
jgi:hypothetical protein